MPSETPIGNVIRPSVIPIRTKGFVKHDVPVVCSPNAINIYQAAGFVSKGAVASQLVGENIPQVVGGGRAAWVEGYISDGDGTAGQAVNTPLYLISFNKFSQGYIIKQRPAVNIVSEDFQFDLISVTAPAIALLKPAN